MCAQIYASHNFSDRKYAFALLLMSFFCCVIHILMHTPRLCCELYSCEIVTSQFQFSPVSFLLSSTIDLNSGANIKQQTSTLSVVQHSYLGLDWTTGMPLVGLPCTYNNNSNNNHKRAFYSQFPSNLG